MTGHQSDGSLSRRSAAANGQVVASKALGVPIVFVEAVDQDGNKVVEKVESEIALLWPYVHKEVVIGKHGKEEHDPVQLPKQVGQDILALLLEYCRYHRYPGRSDKERKIFDEKFIRLDTRRLCELTSAADSLDMRPLVDLSSRALARMIEGKSPDEIRETFHLPDDLTEEEKLEPVKNVADDPRIRLLNRLYAKKRKELADKKAELQRREAGVKSAAHPNKETRTVEELLSFIEEERQGQAKKQGKKKKSRKKKEPTSEELPLETVRSTDSKQSGQGASRISSPGPMSPRSLLRDESISHEGLTWAEVDNLDDTELDDEIEAFERSLRADWEDRRTELILMAGAFPSRPSKGSSHVKTSQQDTPKNGARDIHPILGTASLPSVLQSPLVGQAENNSFTQRDAAAASPSVPAQGVLEKLNGHPSLCSKPSANSTGACEQGTSLPDSDHSLGKSSAMQSMRSGPTNLESKSSQDAAPSSRQQSRRRHMSDQTALVEARLPMERNESQPPESSSQGVHLVASRSGPEDAVLANAACDPDMTEGSRGNGSATELRPEIHASTACLETSAGPMHSREGDGNEQPASSELSPNGSGELASRAEKGTEAECPASEVDSLQGLLQEFLLQLGYEDNISVQLKGSPYRVASSENKDVLIERELPGLGMLRLQCSRASSQKGFIE